MQIQDLFERDIHRSITGVVKADQLDDSAVWQELDEFVITKELSRHFDTFFSAYKDAIERQNDPDVAGNIGVWISGFFGSGKSHFIKVLSYLLGNREVRASGTPREAVSFFEGKVSDPMLYADIKKVVATDTAVILFNIDSKADSSDGRAAILAVFLKVFNEMLGYSGDHPHIAHMERYLDAKGKLAAFHECYKKETGTEWREERDAYEFNHDQVVQALGAALGQSEESASKWIDNAEDNFALTVDNFSKWVREYLDTRGKGHKLIFFIDEVGQYIGDDTHLMLSLQTITEKLGTACNGRAWVVVTSQEDIEAVVGEVKSSKANDFSKIQGRFKTRLSLSSANTDEVIQERLLAKKPDVLPELESLYAAKGDILKNQLSFSNVGMTFKKYNTADDFTRNYPFAPYQFQLVQKIFETIRKAGATGLHLSRGERSMLNAFQNAAQQVAGESLGVLIPLYRFYPSIESFLDTSVKRTIEQAGTNASLDDFDVKLLETLFLIRYVDEIKGNIDNLVTLCVDEIDADRLALRRTIEESLQRLEKETLINRNGEDYFFLTNEERDVSQEIKTTEIESGEEARLMGELIFADVLNDDRKHRYMKSKKDFAYTRLCDFHPIGNKVDKGLQVSVVTPLADDYDLFNDGQCFLKSNDENGHVLIRLSDDESLGRELRIYLKTEKYIRKKNDGTLPATTMRILNERKEEDRQRRERMTILVGELLSNADYFIAGQKFVSKSTTPAMVMADAFNYLIDNTFTKMSYFVSYHDDPAMEMQAILRSNDIGQQALAIKEEDSNVKAVEDVRQFVELSAQMSRKVVLHEMLEGKYALRPYGWPEQEVLLIVARLVVLGEISLVQGGETIPTGKVFAAIAKPANRRKILVVQRRTASTADIHAARALGKDVFSEMGPDNEDGLCDFLRDKLSLRDTRLKEFRPLAETGDYPGIDDIGEGLRLTAKLLQCKDSYELIARFLELKSDLLDHGDAFHDLQHFYEHQRQTWDKLRKSYDAFQTNRLELERDEEARTKLARMCAVLEAAEPYKLIKEAPELIAQVSKANQALIQERRDGALGIVDQHLSEVQCELDLAHAVESLRASCTAPLTSLRDQVLAQTSLAHLAQAEQESVRLTDAAIKRMEEASQADQESGPDTGDGADDTSPPVSVVKKSRVVKPSDICSKTFLESEEDVNGFITKLKSELDAAIAKGERVKIR